MKTCQNCKELNGNNRTDCWKCGSPLPTVKIIPYVRYQNDTWLYIVSILVPFLGMLLGCIYIAKDDEDLGKSLIITSIVGPIILGFFLFIIVTMIHCISG